MRYSSWYWPSAPLRICCLRCRVASRSSGWTKSRPASKVAAASASSAPRIVRNCGERSVRSWATSYSCTPNCAASAAVRSCASLRRNAADPSSMSRRARRRASLTALTSRTRELPMTNGTPRPKAPAAAVAAASGRVRPRPNRKARPMTSPPTNRRVAPQNRSEFLQLLVDHRCRKGDLDGPVGPLAAADRGQSLLPVDIQGAHDLAVRQLGKPRRDRGAHQPRLVAQARHDDAPAVPDGSRPTLRQALALQQGAQILGHETEAHDEANLVAAHHRYRDVVDRLPHHQAGEEVGNHRTGGPPNPLQRLGIARLGRCLAIGHEGVDELMARGIGQHQIGPAPQALLGLGVKSRPILLRQKRGGRQSLQDGDPAIGIAVDVGDQGLEDLLDALADPFALQGHRAVEQDADQQQQWRRDDQSEDDEMNGGRMGLSSAADVACHHRRHPARAAPSAACRSAAW